MIHFEKKVLFELNMKSGGGELCLTFINQNEIFPTNFSQGPQYQIYLKSTE
jgi:hypothetical protein